MSDIKPESWPLSMAMKVRFAAAIRTCRDLYKGGEYLPVCFVGSGEDVEAMRLASVLPNLPLVAQDHQSSQIAMGILWEASAIAAQRTDADWAIMVLILFDKDPEIRPREAILSVEDLSRTPSQWMVTGKFSNDGKNAWLSMLEWRGVDYALFTPWPSVLRPGRGQTN